MGTIQVDFIQIGMTSEDIEEFKLFRQYQGDFKLLLETGFFSYRNGEYSARRDGNGVFTKWKISLEGGRTKEKTIK